jgi:septal ring factor EnvC (AmiA/AmiB activator)
MARKPLDIKARIERQENKILRLMKQLDEAKEGHRRLVEEKKKLDEELAIDAYLKSGKSLDKVLGFLNGKADI